MKTFIALLLAVCCLSFPAQAKVFTVSNNNATPTKYTTITSAITAASAGDTIYILGSPNVYDAITVAKKLAFFGPGFNPDKAVDAIPAMVPKITFSNAAASGSEVNGVVVQSGIFATANISDLIITRNQVAGNIGNSSSASYTYSGWTVSNNFIKGQLLYAHSSSYPLTITNMLCENNVVNHTSSMMINVTGSGVVLLKNNLFIGTTGNAFTSCKNLMVENNIFLNFTGSGLPDDSQAKNNLAHRAAGTLATTFFPIKNALTRDNILNKDPEFANLNLSDVTATSDFTLKSTSAAKNEGADWREMGVFGGNPAANWAYANMPRLPYIHSFTLETTTVTTRGTLKITIVSKSHE
ncbi:MAG: hypothetical protein EOO14_05775 [Chitinophagaceae bacterium]|nr:MAG: hypothetical protein EOO14_05775 [Chitinophagaceae bacterium]